MPLSRKEAGARPARSPLVVVQRAPSWPHRAACGVQEVWLLASRGQSSGAGMKEQGGQLGICLSCQLTGLTRVPLACFLPTGVL